MAANLSALASVAADLFVSLPESPQGKAFLDKSEADSPAGILRAVRKVSCTRNTFILSPPLAVTQCDCVTRAPPPRKTTLTRTSLYPLSQRLNLTQREFGVLLAPPGGSSISPSVVCQLEAALQTVPPPVVERAVAATTAVQKLGEHLATKPESKAGDAALALKALGPGCIDELQPYLDAHPELSEEDAELAKNFLSIVTKRKHSTGGSRPGARGPYRKLTKVTGKLLSSTATNNGDSPRSLRPAGASGANTRGAAPSPALGAPPGAVSPCASGTDSSREEQAEDSGRSTPCSTPGSSRGSSRPRSPTSTTGYYGETTPSNDAKSPRITRERSTSECSLASDSGSSAFTPGGTVVGLGTPTPGSSPRPGSGLVGANGEVSLEVLLALKRLQEQNEALQLENARLRAQHAVQSPSVPYSAEEAMYIEAPAELARTDVSMSC